MSLALEFLKEWLVKPNAPTQGEFAKKCGISAAGASDILNGDTPISSRNLNMLLRGIQTQNDQLAFLSAYLRDQVPTQFSDDIQIHRVNTGEVGEDAAGTEDTESEMLRAFSELPSDLMRRRVVLLLRHLRKDADVRDLFNKSIAVLENK